MTEKYEQLFQPMKIGGMKVKNRVVMTAMGIHSKRLVNHDGSYTDDGNNYFIERAKGGTGLIVTGAMQVQSMFEISHDDTNIARAGEAYVKQMRPLTDGVHQYGAKIVIQLTAGSGRTSPPGLTTGEPIAAGDNMPNVWKPDIIHRALTKEEIQVYIDGFAKGAKVAQEAGFDGVEIHAVHEGYLLDQFATAFFNNRTDEYGGSLENRLRFAREILEAIKGACGKDYPVLMRYSVRSMLKDFNDGALPGEDYTEVGRDLEESKKVAKLLADMGYDALDCDNGTYDSWFWAHPPVYMPEACNLEDIAEIRKVVNVPVIGAGKMGNPDIAEQAIADGKIDAVGLARPLLTDPEWANKIQSGNRKDVRPCIACHVGCLGHLFQGKDMCCALNPTVCREKQLEFGKAETKKKILIIGGGIAGMEAARVCSLRGHEVNLVERSNTLGGVFISAASMSFKREDKELIEWYKYQMEKLNVNILLNTCATEKMIREMAADEVIFASGSSERRLRGVEGADNEHVITAVEALTGEKPIGNNVVIIGAGLTGIETAYELVLSGKHVELVELKETILDMPSLCAANAMMLRQLIKYHQIPIYLNTKLDSIRQNEVIITCTDGTKSLPADTVILSIGYISEKTLYESLKQEGMPAHIIGDADKVANLENAIEEAYLFSMNI